MKDGHRGYVVAVRIGRVRHRGYPNSNLITYSRYTTCEQHGERYQARTRRRVNAHGRCGVVPAAQYRTVVTLQVK